MSVSVVVPWRPTDERQPLWDWCRRRWESEPLVDEIVECDSGQHPFTRGTSINRGVEAAKGDIIVIADADTFVSDIRGAIAMVGSGVVPWCVNYGLWRYYRVDPASTQEYLSGELATRNDPFRFLERCVSYSGCVVLSREAFESVGGFPETLLGWGYEDNCLQHALDTLVGPHARSNGFAVQLFHDHSDESQRFRQPHIGQNRSVSDLYAAATGKPDEMREAILRQLQPGAVVNRHLCSDPPAWRGWLRHLLEERRG
jgi:hypothetical protein